jgi:WD domain, G-beta repeat
MTSIRKSSLPHRLVIVVGTYDGVLGGWEKKSRNNDDDDDDYEEEEDENVLSLVFATSVHQGSIRSLCMAQPSSWRSDPGAILSCGYDELLKTHDWTKRLNSSGEIRTPSDLGTPICSSFAPPRQMMGPASTSDSSSPSTHALIGFTGGKICLYKKRDWSLQHILAGHEGGVASLGVHPSGKLALSGGQSDGKLKLWDLTKGRLAYSSKLTARSTRNGKSFFEPVTSIVWTQNGDAYAWSYGNHITVRDVETGSDLLDAELPSRANQVAIMEGNQGTFLTVACNDGSLPVLSIGAVDDDPRTRRALMAIEPVEGVVAGEERLKCIQSINHHYYVITANSAGVVSIMNLQGAVNMLLQDEDEPPQQDATADDVNESSSTSTSDDDDESDSSLELAVDIVASVQLGTGARVTCLEAWASELMEEKMQNNDSIVVVPQATKTSTVTDMKRPQVRVVEMDDTVVAKARTLVEKAKTMEVKKKHKQQRATSANKRKRK